jgi:hypothetical protein
MSWMNEDMDDLFRELADQRSFRYRKSYFRDIERHLPIRKSRKPMIGMLGFLSFLLLGVLFFAGNNHLLLLKNVQTQKQNHVTRISNRIWASNWAIHGNNFTGKLKNVAEKKNLYQTQVETSENAAGITYHDSDLKNTPSFVMTNEVTNDKTLISELDLKSVELSTNLGQHNHLLEFVQDFNFSPWSLVLSGYSGVSQGWTREHAAATNASVGFQTNLKYTFNRFSLQAGVGTEWMRFDQLNIMERTKIYGLSSQLMENSFAFKSMTSVQVPIAVTYTMGRHQFGAGLSGIFNTVAKVKRTCSLDGQGIYNSEGYTDAKLFGTFHLQSELQYHFNVTEDLSIGVEAGVRITNPIQSDRMEGDYVKHPVFLNFVLSKSLTKNP